MDATTNAVIVRQLHYDDIERLVRMDRDVSNRIRHRYIEGKLRHALSDSDVKISLGAEVDACLVGAMLGTLQYGEFGQPEPVAILDTVLVDPRFARQGIASALLGQLCKKLGAFGIRQLRTQVDWNDVELMGYFAHTGFVPVPSLVLELDVPGFVRREDLATESPGK